MSEVIKISELSSLSALGASYTEVSSAYLSEESEIKDWEIEGASYACARLSESSETKLRTFLEENPIYKKLDRSVQCLLYSGRSLFALPETESLKQKRGFISIGSSRGATGIFEKAMASYLSGDNVPALTSPRSTIGNLSSWLMQDLKLRGAPLSTSVTCSSALQAFLNGVAWLKSGMADYAVVGGSEAPLTGFTLAQMKALRIYAKSGLKYPCMPCAEVYESGAGMVLSEGAALFTLEKSDTSRLKSGDIYVSSFGYSSEIITSATSISPEADALFESMKMAISNATHRPEVVILHAPGTEQGDRSEINAINKLGYTPLLLSNKWKIGHTFGAAGAFNLEYAIHLLRDKKYIDFPYKTKFNNNAVTNTESVMLNAAGFGGNAISIIVSVKD